MNDLISIIVPVHNCEKTIERCLLSITKQTYSNLEILLIENESTDHSLEICKQWAAADSRIKIFNSSVGVSNARNKGLEQMSGTYFGFVDADDYIELTMYEKLHTSIVAEKTDMSFCRIYNFFEDGSIHESAETKLEELIKEKNISYWYREGEQGVRRVIWRTLFKREVYGSIRFDTRIFFGEDRDYLQNCYMLSSNCSLVNEYLYYYYCNYYIPNYTAKKYYKERRIFESRSILTCNCVNFLSHHGFVDLAKEQRFKALLLCIEDAAVVDKDYRGALKKLFTDPFWNETNSKQCYKAYLQFHGGFRERVKAFLVRCHLYYVFRIVKNGK